jgi:hypothetical protein
MIGVGVIFFVAAENQHADAPHWHWIGLLLCLLRSLTGDTCPPKLPLPGPSD